MQVVIRIKLTVQNRILFNKQTRLIEQTNADKNTGIGMLQERWTGHTPGMFITSHVLGQHKWRASWPS